MAQFNIRVKQEVLQQRLHNAQTASIDKVSQQFQLNKDEIYGDGLDIQEAQHLPFDQFMQLSGNDTKITKADILKFDKTMDASQIIDQYAQEVANSLPVKQMDTASGNGDLLEFRVMRKGLDIVVSANRHSPDGAEGAPDPTSSAVFSVINGRDLNGDGQIAVGGELSGSAFVNTAGDAIKLAGEDMQVSPVEALKAIFEQSEKGHLPLGEVDITYSGN